MAKVNDRTDTRSWNHFLGSATQRAFVDWIIANAVLKAVRGALDFSMIKLANEVVLSMEAEDATNVPMLYCDILVVVSFVINTELQERGHPIARHTQLAAFRRI